MVDRVIDHIGLEFASDASPLKGEKVYISGSMKGEDNFDLFNELEDWLNTTTLAVVNPAKNFGGRGDLPREVYMKHDVANLVTCTACVMLPRWYTSAGAKVEFDVACELGLKIYFYVPARGAGFLLRVK